MQRRTGSLLGRTLSLVVAGAPLGGLASPGDVAFEGSTDPMPHIEWHL